MAVLEHAWQRFGLDAVLAGVGSERKQRLLKAMIFGRILFPSSKLALREEARGTLLSKVRGLEEKQLEEDERYRAMDGLNGVWSGIERKLYRGTQPDGASLVLYDLSSVYFEGMGRRDWRSMAKPKITGRIGVRCFLRLRPMAGGSRFMWRSCAGTGRIARRSPGSWSPCGAGSGSGRLSESSTGG